MGALFFAHAPMQSHNNRSTDPLDLPAILKVMRLFPRLKVSIEKPPPAWSSDIVQALEPLVQALQQMQQEINALRTDVSRVEKRQQRGKDPEVTLETPPIRQAVVLQTGMPWEG